MVIYHFFYFLKSWITLSKNKLQLKNNLTIIFFLALLKKDFLAYNNYYYEKYGLGTSINRYFYLHQINNE